jgi:hypothetical protein
MRLRRRRLTGGGQPLPNADGAILAHIPRVPNFEARVLEDPFDADGVVSADIVDIAPSRTDEGSRS